MQQQQDRYGLPITTSSVLAAEHFNEGLDLLLEQNYGPEEQFTKAIEADADFALAYSALAYMLHQRALAAEARERVQQAQALAATTSAREQQHIAIVALFVNGQGTRAYALSCQHLAEYPRDILVSRLVQRLFALGCSGAGVASFPAVFFQLTQSLAPAYGDDWAFLGQYAFAHHETGRFAEARRLAERSLALRPSSGVAAHSIAHACFEMGDVASGGDFLATWLPSFDRRAPYRVHLGWHHALFELAQGHYQRVLDLYEDTIRPAVAARQVTALNDSAALLWRCALYSGATLPVAPEEVRDLAVPAASRPGPAFRDSHAALAFAVAGDDVHMEQMIDRLRTLASQGDTLAGEVTLPLVQGIHAFAHGAYDEAVRCMGPLFVEPRMDQISRIGGSHAQREVFEDTMIEAYLRAAHFDQAEAMLRTRLQRRETARDLFWLGRSQTHSKQPETARDTLQKVAQQWHSADAASPERMALQHLMAQAQ